MKPANIVTFAEGQRWYVSIGSSSKVDEVRILDLTDRTVLLEFTGDSELGKFGIEIPAVQQRYRFDRVVWLEKLKARRK